MNDILDDAFESPKLLIEEAGPATQELDKVCQTYLDENHVEMFDYVDEARNLRIVGHRIPEVQPKRARVLASRIVKDLRDALDQATFQATKSLDPKAGTRTYFPFCRDPDDFETLFVKDKGRCRDIPGELRPFLKSLEPWPTGEGHAGGNDLLRALGYVAGPNKHQVTLHVSTTPALTNIGRIAIEQGGMPWTWRGRDLEVIHSVPGTALDYDFGSLFVVTFKEPRQLANGPAPAVLRNLASIVERIVLGIEAETARILRERGQ